MSGALYKEAIEIRIICLRPAAGESPMAMKMIWPQILLKQGIARVGRMVTAGIDAYASLVAACIDDSFEKICSRRGTVLLLIELSPRRKTIK